MNTMINSIKIMKMKMKTNTNTNRNLKNNKLWNRKQLNLQRKCRNRNRNRYKKRSMKKNSIKFMMIIVRRRKFYSKIRIRRITDLICKLWKKRLVIGLCLKDTPIRIWVKISRKVVCSSSQSNSLLQCSMVSHFSWLSNKSNMS